MRISVCISYVCSSDLGRFLVKKYVAFSLPALKDPLDDLCYEYNRGTMRPVLKRNLFHSRDWRAGCVLNLVNGILVLNRSEERRVGKECVRRSRYRGSTYT